MKGKNGSMTPTTAPTPSGKMATRQTPQRRCLVTRSTRPKAGLIRFVVGPGDELTPDLAERLPGFGLWVTADARILHEAISRKIFAKAAGQNVKVPPDLLERLTVNLRKKALETLGLARGAGQVVAGYEKVEAWLRDGKAAILVQASDGAADGKRKLAAIAGDDVPQIEDFDAASLAAALGREWVIHAAIKPGGLAQQFLRDARRFAGVKTIESGTDGQ